MNSGSVRKIGERSHCSCKAQVEIMIYCRPEPTTLDTAARQ
ncbi:hypothetical protein [Pseudomonas syringae]|nr:hypothetical protein [Pseudomonas syringae]